MADITMCSGNYCELAQTCYRYKASPTPHYQSYFMSPPVKNGKCEYYWEVKTDKDEQ
jgi:hypothetical protein